MNPEQKGWLTSEFWIAMGVQIIGVLVLLGVLGTDESKDVGDFVTKAVENIFALLGMLGTAWRYLQTREGIKKAKIDGEAKKETAKIEAEATVTASQSAERVASMHTGRSASVA